MSYNLVDSLEKKKGFGKDHGGREQRALLGLQSDLGCSLCAVRGRRALLTEEILSHSAQLNTSAGLMSLKELLAKGPKALGQDLWKSNWVCKI